MADVFGGRDSPIIVAQSFATAVITWSNRLTYNSNAVTDAANDLN